MSRLPLSSRLLPALCAASLAAAAAFAQAQDATPTQATPSPVPTVSIPAASAQAVEARAAETRAVEAAESQAAGEQERAAPVIVIAPPSNAPPSNAEVPGEAAAAPSEAAVVEPGSEDSEALPPMPRNGWVARFFWSPEYCDKNAGNKELQCNPQLQGFVLRDLIRVVNGRDVDDCAGGSLLMSPEMLEQVSRFTKNRAETRASWRLYGRCSGLSEIDYASWTEFVDRRMVWPETLVPGGKNVSTTAAELIAALAADNPGLSAETLVLQCNRSWLKSVDVCLDGSFQYDKAACPKTSSCGNTIKVLGKP